MQKERLVTDSRGGAGKKGLLTEGQPLLLDENFESLDRAIVRVEDDLSESHELRGPIPPIGAVDKHGRLLLVDETSNLRGSLEDQTGDTRHINN